MNLNEICTISRFFSELYLKNMIGISLLLEQGMPISLSGKLDHIMIENKNSLVLEMKGITKRFGGVTALDNVDFELFAGEIHSIVGENGAGKSTLAKIISGTVTDYEGEYFFGGAKNPIP